MFAIPRPSKVIEVESDPDLLDSSVFELEDDDDVRSISSISPMIRRSKIMIIVVLLLGLGGGIAFIVLGIQNENAAANKSFEISATQLAKDIGSTVEEYETAALSVQNVCRRRETTRHEFRQFYGYLISGGLQVQAAQCVPNVTHAERPAFEKSAREYYNEFYPDINYTGFKGWEYSEATGSYVLVPFRLSAPFYFPVDKSEPVVPNAAALGLDTYSHPFQKNEIEQALATNKPVLGGRLKLVQETEENAYTVIMRHPGIDVAEQDSFNLDDRNDQNIGNILIRIPSLLKRRGNEQKDSIACYLYDFTPSNTNGIQTYLGAAEYEASLSNGTVTTEVRIPPHDIEYEDVLSSQKRNRIFETTITIASNAIWTLVITPIPGDDSFEPEVAQLIFGGSMLIVCTIGLVIFLWRNIKQVKAIHKAKSQAEAERKIIASLYPENVVERLLDDERARQEASKERARNKGAIFDGKARDGGSTVDSAPLDGSHNSGSNQGDHQLGGLVSIFGSDPIAHHYQDTTVVFMDMVGFTAWSQSREPSQVFTLLENTYNAFDLLAKRRRVFKVETVGDCYVAVVGVPEPKRNHAAVMVLFANACLEKMTSLMHQLAPTLGEDTASLDLRIGMSSGPVTGGVLRGEKGRFQLFGDTMNTAARMESNGKRGMIQVSPATAERLIASGRGKWLTQREDKIVAKGIGEMTTYWVKVNSDSVQSGYDSTQASGETLSPHGETGKIESTILTSGSESPVENSSRNLANRATPPKSSTEHILSL